MKKSYNVWWSETAENDLVSMIEYIAGESPLQARKIFGEIKKRTESLNAFPDRGRMVPELKNQGITLYHELIIEPWRVMYRVSEDSVYVLSVLDSRQNVEDILLQRLIAWK
ncbi:MAG: type II toxin-antitoxin system RelE/ParE family toxin [Smithellaceae bacterium]|jgi:plasmid stabilization system protein ParE|nr:type II toxin-antitoxin system RelE/ParE family toxin [Smithellaceae bacterium]MDD3260147.1 type II toxin-antitoxin system RelE/ParE family toxin [Smithellaceae bacterium]MDD3849467.1 type II toxin-antitoxin system RelE/ParE family toxin [Smithellaceae bacterium]